MPRYWANGELEIARKLVQEKGYTEGIKAAADHFGVSAGCMRDALRRAASKRDEDNGPPTERELPKPEESTLQETIDAFNEARNRRGESTRIKTLERDVNYLHKCFDTLSTVASAPLPSVERLELGSGLREACAVAMLSDAHVEEEVRAGDTPVGNKYNLAIAERSLSRFFAGYRWLIDFHRTAFKIRQAVCWLGGDLITGHIHEENIETTAFPPVEAVLWLRPRLMAGIDLLLADPELETLLIPCSYGNHGRNTKKPFRSRGAEHSYEWLMYQVLADHYRNEPRVRFLADRSAHQYVQAYGYDLHFTHGDEIKYHGGLGGITIPVNKRVAAWDVARRCHYHHFGHFHTYEQHQRWTANGSVIGYNAYAMAMGANPEPPQQAFYLLDSRRGKTCKSPIWVRDSADM